LNIVFTLRIFEQLELAQKTEFALNFSSQGAAAPPAAPRTPLYMHRLCKEGRKNKKSNDEKVGE